SRLDPYGGGGGNSNSSHHMLLDGSRGGGGGGIGLHAGGMMPPSPYNGPQMSPYGGPQQVPQAALMGGMPPLTPELHSGGMMGYQLEARSAVRPDLQTTDVRCPVEPAPLPLTPCALIGACPDVSRVRASRATTGGTVEVVSKIPGCCPGYGLDPRYPRVLQSPRGPSAYPDPMAHGGGMYAQQDHHHHHQQQQQQQQQTPASPMLASRRLPQDL
ncbi:unnamed protein product, partial [Scytosiphon promiscuus]